MISTAAPPAANGDRLRALVVEPDAAVRLRVTGLLQRQDCDVHACDDWQAAALLYDGHDIVVAAVSGDGGELPGFVERIRTTGGDRQPFILGLPAGSAVKMPLNAADWGLNDALSWPVDTEHLNMRLSAIVRQCAARPRPGPAEAPWGGWDSPATAMLLEQLPSAVAVLDRDMRYVAANQRWRREFQIQGLQVIGQCHFDLFPDLHPAWRDLYHRCLAGHRERTEDDLFIRADGSQDWVRWDIQPWMDAAAGRAGGLILSCSIVSAGARDRTAFSFEQSLANTLLHSPLAPVVLVDTAGRIVRCNPAARELAASSTLEEGRTFFWNALASARRREGARQRLLELLQAAASPNGAAWPAPGGLALTLPARQGGPAGIAWTVFPHRRTGGDLEGLILIGFPPAAAKSPPDMTDESKPAGSAAGPVPDELSGVDYRRLAEAAPFGMIVLNDDAAVLYANPQHRAVLGFSISECGGIKEWLERACAADEDFRRRALDEWWERVWRRRAPWTCSLRTAEGMLKEVEFRPVPLPDHKLLLTVLDVTDARLEEQALRASEARYRGLFQNCASGVAVLNASGNITESNPALEELTGLTRGELRRAGLTAFLSAGDAALVREAVAAGEHAGREIPVRIKTKGGEEIPAGLSWSSVRNDEGVIVYTACLLHPGVQRSIATPPRGWTGADWSRTVPDWVLLLDGFGRIIEHSDARDFAGVVPREALSGRTLEETVPAIADLLPVDVMIERLRENPGAETRCEFNTVLTPGGKPHFIEARMLSLAPPGSDGRFGLVLRDLTALATRQTPSGGALPWLRNLSTPVIITNERGRIAGLNPAAEQLLGWPAAALEGSGLYRIFRPENPKGFSEEISAELGRSRSWRTRTEFTRKDGVKTACEVELVPAHDEVSGTRGFVTLIRPVMDPPAAPAAEAAPAVSSSGRPAVTLHRARNDLQVLSSLLTLQAERADGEVRSALLAGKDRLNAVAIVYRLINSEDDTVDFHRYAAELGRMLLETRKVPMERIKIEVSGDSVRLPQKTAITLGLIVEELLAGAIAESFPGGSSGTIRISLTAGAGEGVLIVRDNGTLLTDALRERRLGSFSWQMVQTLAEPIGGVVTLLSDLENQVRLRFRLQPPP